MGEVKSKYVDTQLLNPYNFSIKHSKKVIEFHDNTITLLVLLPMGRLEFDSGDESWVVPLNCRFLKSTNQSKKHHTSSD